MTRVITVTSGKGGVGKTNISANLAIHLAALGYRTCLFDADLGLANINILLKLYPEYNLKDVILHNKDIHDIIIEPYPGMDIIPGSSGVEEMANLNANQVVKLITEFSKLDTYDYFIVDTAAGVSRDVISFCLASSELVLVITPDPTSLTDAYSLLKILTLNGFREPVMIVINQSPGIQSAKNALGKMAATCTRYLSLKLIPIGVMGRDQNVVSAVSKQKPFITLYPNTSASKSIKKIAENLVKKKNQENLTLEMETFWEKCLSFFAKKLRTTIKKPEDTTNSTNLLPEASEQKAALDDRYSSASTSGDTPENHPSGHYENGDEYSGKPLDNDQISPDNAPSRTKTDAGLNAENSENENTPHDSPKMGIVDKSANLREIPETTQMILQTNQLLNQVVESIASVATELKEIRELFAKSKSDEKHKSQDETSEKRQNSTKKESGKDDNQLTSLLSNYAMFQSLEDHEIKSIVKHLKLREAMPGEIIIQKGEPGENLHIIISGKVDVMDEQGNVLDTMQSEDVFGEMSLISGDPVNATIKVLEKARILYLNGKEFIRLLRTYPGLQMYFARLLSKRLSNRLKKADKAKTEYLKSGLSGSLEENSIPELLQMLNLGRKTGVISFTFPKTGKASISFLNGELIAAKYGESQKDIGAFYHILEESKGRFTYVSELPENDRGKTPFGHFMRLLMEGISRVDEKRG
ncbi:hypothetical protein MTBBW1_2160006 [Desulfamplus magnetovallimortis]|uniref:Cyclic nucleotide-binding domain-containing protein n=1 Tax=Desulfamplus magnetovallimortis TaxID=1246637 RepID=A0A1W1HCR4_9BACT|nr:cyclic nucleotide-binding domain-containing protein [Desulfamplus magnetovallimortis]SLM30226.1 hypothetical protein MTBBW1_2160006 [Desulfamplus magnetovallimortis]